MLLDTIIIIVIRYNVLLTMYIVYVVYVYMGINIQTYVFVYKTSKLYVSH